MKHGQKIKKKCTFALMEAGFASSAPLSAVIPHMAHDACFTFAGKERDEETGLSYFGARYYDADLTTNWLSVDPMADKYPSMSPYSYCAGNPVKLVDPDGMDVWELDNSGKIVSHKTDKSYDQVKILGAAGDIICSSDKYEYGSITELNLDGTENTTFRVRGLPEAENLFEFLAD